LEEKFDSRKKKCFNITVDKKKVVGLNTFYIYRTTDFCPTKGVDLRGNKYPPHLSSPRRGEGKERYCLLPDGERSSGRELLFRSNTLKNLKVKNN